MVHVHLWTEKVRIQNCLLQWIRQKQRSVMTLTDLCYCQLTVLRLTSVVWREHGACGISLILICLPIFMSKYQFALVIAIITFACLHKLLLPGEKVYGERNYCFFNSQDETRISDLQLTKTSVLKRKTTVDIKEMLEMMGCYSVQQADCNAELWLEDTVGWSQGARRIVCVNMVHKTLQASSMW